MKILNVNEVKIVCGADHGDTSVTDMITRDIEFIPN